MKRIKRAALKKTRLKRNPRRRVRKVPSSRRTLGRFRRAARRIVAGVRRNPRGAKRAPRVRANPAWRSECWYVMAAVNTARGRIAGYWTGAGFDTEPHRAHAYVTRAAAMTAARKAARLARSSAAVFSGDVTLHRIKQRLKL